MHNRLKELFTGEEKIISVPDSEIKIHNIDFISDEPVGEFLNHNDTGFSENSAFSYPVFAPAEARNSSVILLLHGLNERSWLKYLAWAYYLSELTGSFVILFPISFHINRSPSSWRDPRSMSVAMVERRNSYGEIPMLSFANVALSERLSQDPLRFFFSGYRTVSDLVKLLVSVRKGEHSIIPAGSKLNIFAYSIGAFMAQVVMMANPENLFEDSKLFMLCGGSVFSNMQGTSKLIMDRRAFERIYDYYLNDFENIVNGKGPLIDFLKDTRLGLSFRSMIDTERLRPFREKIIKELGDRMHAVSLVKDKVIPYRGIVQTMALRSSCHNVEVMDLPYGYSHENPFPVYTDKLSAKVNSCFEKIITGAAEFFSGCQA